jgi:methyl-accepting chemotaxis protein
MGAAGVPVKRTVLLAGLASLLAATVTGLAGYRHAGALVEAAAWQRLTALRDVRSAALVEYLESVREETRFWNKNRVMRSALREFSAAYAALGPNAGRELQRLYVHENPYPVGQKDNLETASDGSQYTDVHARYHYWLRSFLLHRGVYDVFLFDPNANLVYTSFKELDFATNLETGRWKDSDLGHAFRAARDNPFPSYVAFFDFAPYEPSHGEPASFFSSPVLADDGAFLGVVAFQIPADRIDEILQVTAGMGETGESYAVGSDLLMRSDSRFEETSTILRTRVDTEPSRRALAGEIATMVAPDYRGVPVFSAFAPLDFEGVRWALLAEIDQAEVLAPLQRLGGVLLGAGAFGVALASGLAAFLARRRSSM